MSTIRLISITFCLLLLASLNARAQEAIAISKLVNTDEEISARDIARINQSIIISDTLNGWDYNWRGGVNGAQAAYNNWSNGGVNTISVTGSTFFNALFRNGRYGYGFSTNLRYGQARISEEGTRKTDDRIAINNKFSYQFTDERWNAFANVNFATQFDKGFNFNADEPELISEFMAPAYFTQVAGIGFQPSDYFATEMGMALKQTFVLNDSLSTQYGLDQGDNFRFEPGISLSFIFEKEILKNLTLSSSVETFSNLERNINRTDVFFTNELTGKINDYLNMSFQFATIYDDDFNSELQVKQVLSAGLSVNIL